MSNCFSVLYRNAKNERNSIFQAFTSQTMTNDHNKKMADNYHCIDHVDRKREVNWNREGLLWVKTLEFDTLVTFLSEWCRCSNFYDLI